MVGVDEGEGREKEGKVHLLAMSVDIVHRGEEPHSEIRTQDIARNIYPQ